MAIADIAQESIQRAEPQGLRFTRRFTRQAVHPYDEVEWELRDSAIAGEGGNVFENEGVIVEGGWGSGVNVSKFRSKKEQRSGGGYASGPVSFMRGADSVAGSIKSGGTTRRAAKMVVLDADHPDVREFIWCKAKEEKKAWALGEAGYDMGLNGEAWQSIQFQNANNSVRATDDFMQKAIAGDDWALTARVDGATVETLSARALLKEISQAASEGGDPWMQF